LPARPQTAQAIETRRRRPPRPRPRFADASASRARAPRRGPRLALRPGPLLGLLLGGGGLLDRRLVARDRLDLLTGLGLVVRRLAGDGLRAVGLFLRRLALGRVVGRRRGDRDSAISVSASRTSAAVC